MSKKLILIVTICSTGILSVGYGQRLSVKKRSQRSKMTTGIAPQKPITKSSTFSKGDGNGMSGLDVVNGESGNPPYFLVAVDPTLNLDAPTLALYQQVATAFTGYTGIPNDRLNYYSALNNPPNYSITGWQGILSNVQQNGNGYIASVRVVPFINSSTYGDGTYAISCDYSEQYQISNGAVQQYLGFQDPEGTAGQMPVLVGL